MSHKFTMAQFNYATWEHELLAVLEVLLRWEDKLLGLKFIIVTNHKALTFFKEAPYSTPRHMRWWEYLSRFDFRIEYIRGESNKVADSLSRYYMSDSPDEIHDISEYVNADSRLDPEGDNLPRIRMEELISMRATLRPCKPRAEEVQDRIEPRNVEAAELRDNNEAPKVDWDVKDHPKVNEVLPLFGNKYSEDQFLSNIWKNPDRHNLFEKNENLLWTTNQLQQRVVCVPKGTHQDLNI